MSKLVTFAALAAACFVFAPLAAQDVQDSTIAAAEAHGVVFENEHVRVISALASPGHKSPMHSHPPMVIISLGTARVKFTNPDGSEAFANLRPGMAFWRDEVVHSWELIAGEADVIAVEVKAAKAAPSPDQ